VKVLYVAHCLSAATDAEMEQNRRAAARWAAWLAETFDVAVVCDWIVLSSAWSEAEGRERGLEIDKALIGRCDGMVLFGPRVSSGMDVEAQHARSVGIPVFSFLGQDIDQPDRISWSLTHRLGEWIEELREAA